VAKQTTIQGQDVAKELIKYEEINKDLNLKLASAKNRLKEVENDDKREKFDVMLYCAGTNYSPEVVPGLNLYVKARFDRLCGMIRRYGQHEKGCNWPLRDCTCGLSEVFNDYGVRFSDKGE
jgi:hypothetical protein